MVIIPFMISCNQKKIENLESRNDSLVQQANMKDSSINEFLASLNSIQRNLDSIKATEMIISEKTEGKTELKKATKDQINEDINKIYQLLLENKQKVASLKNRLGSSNMKISELEVMVENLTQAIADNDAEIEDLRVKLENMNVRIVKLSGEVEDLTEENLEKSAMIQQQTQEIEQKTEKLNEAYYVIGSKRELLDNNVITREGGFIGIGANKVLKPDFNEQMFKRIDIRNVSKLAVKGKKAEIVTNHPPGSYEITGSKDNWTLVINDRAEFWKSSRYLVIIND